MRASRTAVAGIALLLLAQIPVAAAISAAAAPPAPRTLGLDDVGDTVGDVFDTTTDTVDEMTGPVDDVPDPPTQTPAVPDPVAPKPAPEPIAPAPAPATPKPAPRPVTTLGPTQPPAPAPAPKPSGTTSGESGSGSVAGSGAGSSSGSGRVEADGRSASPTTDGASGTSAGDSGTRAREKAQGPGLASAGPRTSSTLHEGAAPLLPETNAGDPDIRSLLIGGGGQRTEGISHVADNTPGSVTGLLVLGTLASLMLYGSAAYLRFGRRRPVSAGKHKA